MIVVEFGAGACRRSFSPSATAVAFSDESTSGCSKAWTARVMFVESVVSSDVPSSPSIRVWNTRPFGSP